MIINILSPRMLLWLAPILIIFLILLAKNFVEYDFDKRDKKERKKFKRIMFITRVLIFVLLVIVLARPFGEVKTTTAGNPKLTILVDNTTSMDVLESEFFSEMKQELEKEVPVTIKTLGSGMDSDLGDEILNYVEQDANLLLITDGNVNKGTELGDIALLAANLNSTISAIHLQEKEKEVGVYINGIESTVAGVNNTYEVVIVNLGVQEARLKVSIDGEVLYNEVTKNNRYVFKKEFKEGEHKIIAEISATEDYFENNNVFYKSVSVVKKPKILLISDAYAPFEKILNELYDVTKTKNIPNNLDDYYAVIIYDKPANIAGIEKLADYLVDKKGGFYGNGLFVVGGFDSFDRGDYKNSLLESYLPVYVGKASRKRGTSNIVIAIDFSGSSGDRWICPKPGGTGCGRDDWVIVKSDVQNVEKALAVSVIKSLGPDNSVGATIFSSQSAVVSDLQPLFLTKENLIDKISRIQQPAGQSFFHVGLSGAYALLKEHVGTNNIIFITDGSTGSDSIKQQTLDTARTINARGVKIYVVGTGRNVDEAFLKSVAHNGGGIYFPADQQNRLKILFGEPEDTKFGELFDLFTLNPYHFITQDLDLDASLYGFNQVIPKSSAQLLLTTQHGEPAVTVWNYGLGRVAALNVFSGNNNLGDLLNKRNSILLTRITNWVIGDPQRKEPYYVVISDSRINNPVGVVVKSQKYPSAEGISFTRIAEDQYQTEFMASEKGFSQVLGKSFAVNYETEYQNLGMNSKLEEVVAMSGGKIFKSSDAEEIVEFVKTTSKKTRLLRTTIIWPFLLSAVIIFLIEIAIRKIREYKLNR